MIFDVLYYWCSRKCTWRKNWQQKTKKIWWSSVKNFWKRQFQVTIFYPFTGRVRIHLKIVYIFNFTMRSVSWRSKHVPEIVSKWFSQYQIGWPGCVTSSIEIHSRWWFVVVYLWAEYICFLSFLLHNV